MFISLLCAMNISLFISETAIGRATAGAPGRQKLGKGTTGAVIIAHSPCGVLRASACRHCAHAAEPAVLASGVVLRDAAGGGQNTKQVH